MPAEITPDDVQQVARRDKLSFQRLAVDLLRLHAEADSTVRGFDPPQGQADQGFDAEISGTFGDLRGQIRVSVKGNLDWKGLRAAAHIDARRHPEAPLLLVTALPLTRALQDRLAADARKEGVPAVAVVDGGRLAEWLRDAPHLVEAYVRPAVAALVPAELGRARFRPRVPGHEDPGPLLPSEERALAEVRTQLAAGSRLILLVYDPHTRAGRCLWTLLDEGAPGPRVATWVVTDARTPFPTAAAADPAFRARPHLLLAPWGAHSSQLPAWFLDLPTPGDRAHAMVLAVPLAEVTGLQAEAEREGAAWTEVRLPVPAEDEDLDAWLTWLLPKVTRMTARHHLAEAYERRPALLDEGSANPALVRDRAKRDFGGLSELAAAGGIALLGAWPLPGEVGTWLLRWLGQDRTALDATALRGEQRGWFRVQGAARVPTSRAARWALVQAWVKEDALVLPRLVQALAETDAPSHAGLVDGMVAAELHKQVEAWGLRELHDESLARLAPLLPALARCGRGIHERALSVSLRAPDALLAHHWDQVAAVAELTPFFPENLLAAVRVCGRLARVQHAVGWGRDPVGDLLQAITSPDRARARWVQEVLEYLPVEVQDGRLPVELVTHIVEPWLLVAVEQRESSRRSISIGTATWNNENPHLPACWSAAAEAVRAILAAEDAEARAVGWTLLGKAGDRPHAGPMPQDLQPPGALVDALRGLARAAVVLVPDATDWPARHQAEWALLTLIERSVIDEDLAQAILASFSRDPLFRAWQLCLDRWQTLADPTGYAAERVAQGVEGARRARLEIGAADLDPRAEALGSSLCQAGADTHALQLLLARLAQGMVDRPNGYRAFEVLRVWASCAPATFEPLILGPGWAQVPRPLRRALLWAVAPVFGARLLGTAQGGGATRPRGADLELLRLLGDPERVPTDQALDLLPTVELLVEPRMVLGTLHRLALHEDPWVRAQLGGWLYRQLLRHPVDERDLLALVRRLCRAPGGLPAIEYVNTAVRRELPHQEVLREALVTAFLAHAEGESEAEDWDYLARHTYPFRPYLRAALLRAPRAWWSVVARLPLDHGDASLGGLLDGGEGPLEIDGLIAALRACPFPLDQVLNQRARIIDALVARCPPQAIGALAEAMVAEGRVADARALLVSKGAEPAVAPVLARIGAAIENEAEQAEWIHRIAFGGLYGIHSFGPYMGEAPPEMPTDPRAASLREAATGLPAKEARVLRLLADAVVR